MPDRSVDVVVVGAGAAGIACAVTAVENGARTLLLDKSDDVGGALHISAGHLSAAGTDRQAERGIDDDWARHRADIDRISRGTATGPLVDLAVRGAADTMRWLVDDGYVYAHSVPRIVSSHEAYSQPRTYYGPGGGQAVLRVLRHKLDRALAGGLLELSLGSYVPRLLLDPAGAVVGVQVRAGDRQYRVLAARVVLATGGYGANPALLADLESPALRTSAWHTATGDGLTMAVAVGADVAGRGTWIPTFGGLPADPDDGGRAAWPARPVLTADRVPWEIYVDRRGRRFMAEDEPSIDAKERVLTGVEGMTFWQVLDARAVRASQPVVAGWTPGELAERANRHPGVHAADTLAGLARLAGIEPDGLIAQVREYNAAVARGHDPVFGRRSLPAPVREPPFYALENHGTTLVTFAGVAVDVDLAVVDGTGRGLPGLYAVGEVLGAAATCGNSFCGGMLLTPALTLGRLLGARLAQTVPGLRNNPQTEARNAMQARGSPGDD